jgi:hypothetical protein
VTLEGFVKQRRLLADESSVSNPKAASIKGSVFQAAPEDLNRLVAEGRVSREALEARLEAEDIELLDHKVQPTGWYAIASYGRMVELLAELEGGADREAYLVSRGARAAARISTAGTYQQLETTSEQLGPRVGKIVITVAKLFYNFSSWHFDQGDDLSHYTIRVEGARDLPEANRLAAQGFIAFVGEKVGGHAVEVTSERPRPDQILFHAQRAD